ncbi:MAG: putative glycoside hydrolase [Labilithrix sp.]|nr:putative glycoside hydrolase [Labilithrix sp.]
MVRAVNLGSMPVVLACAALSVLASCSSRTSAQPQSARDGSPDGAGTGTTTASTSTSAEAPSDAGAPVVKAAGKKEETPADVTAYIKSKLPKGGSVEGEPAKIRHKVQAGESLASIAAAYLELTEVYRVEELATAIGKANANVAPGATITIPQPLTRILHAPKEDKLGWPEDKILRGVFVTGSYASIRWADTVEKVADHGLNAIVLDAKDYDGYINYPSKAKIAVESGAIRDKNIPDLARAIRYAHWHGVRVILRIPCFHDPWVDKHLAGSRLSIRYTPTGKPIHVDWIDPTLPESQDYAIELAREGIEAGADEIQLDYVRFPVHLPMKVAVLPPQQERSKIIRDFVKRVHAVTQPAGVYLSLDFFGVAATGERDDIERLGQDIAVVAPEADAISLMTYPSHYGKGYMGFTNPADHPEIIGIGNKAALAQLKPTGAKTIFRTWLQAFPLGVTHYNSQYLLAQAKSAETSGGHGWLMWSPACEYSPVWNGWPSKKKQQAQAQASAQ